MAAYTPSLRLTLPVTGTEDGTWGDTVNNGITSLTDASIAGTATVVQGDVANYTLTNNSGATDQARNMFLNITGALSAARNVVCPAVSKLYFIKNSTTGGFAVTLKTSGGSGISVPSGAIAALYCDGTSVLDAVTYLSAVKVGGLTASQAVFTDASKNLVSNAITGTGNVVMSTSPTLVTPDLGTPSAVVLTSGTGLPLTTGVTGTLPVANGGTNLTAFTANGVVYASSTSALATSSFFTYNDSTGLSLLRNLVQEGNSYFTGSITAIGSTTGTSTANPSFRLVRRNDWPLTQILKFTGESLEGAAVGMGLTIASLNASAAYENRYRFLADGSAQYWGIGAAETMQLTSAGLTVARGIVTRVNSQTTTTSPWAWNSDSYDQQEFTALANALTINADAGTPANGQKTIFRFTDNGVARALTWITGSSKAFRAVGVLLPTTTIANKTLYVGCIFNSTASRWDVIAAAQEA